MSDFIDKLKIRVVGSEELTANIDNIAADVARVASDGFGPDKVMSPERMVNRLKREPFIVLAEEGSRLLGFQFQSLYDTPEERYMYYSAAVEKAQQGKGIAQLLMGAAIDSYEPTIVGARSQNPIALFSFVRGMRRRGAEAVYPFNDGEDSELRQRLPEFLAHIGLSGEVDLATGLNRNAYGEGRLGDYVVEPELPGVGPIEYYLRSIGLDRQAGDAVFCAARVAETKRTDNC